MKRSGKLIFLLTVLFTFLLRCEPPRSADEKEIISTKKPVNIVLLIGDGMGLSQVSTTFYFKNDATSQFQRFKFIGLTNTSSAREKITDSAAAGTALACGESTYNGAIGVDMQKKPVRNIVEYVSAFGYYTGIIATSSITHATPASFYAHVASRSMDELIASQLTESEVDIFMGGGLKFFENREDGTNLFPELQNNGFEIFNSINELPELNTGKKYGVLAAPDGLPPAHQGRGDFLGTATEKALNYLSAQQEPFFLMIEGSQIDWAAHGNDSDYLIAEMLDFDKTIGKVLDFADQDKETLVIVTADHETGGTALAAANSEDGNANYDRLSFSFATGGHTATLIPVFATGPGASEFAGTYKNTEIYHKIIKLLDLETLKAER